MKPLITLMLIIAAVYLPGRAGAQDRKMPIKASDGTIHKQQEALPIKPSSGENVPPRTKDTPPQGVRTSSVNPADKNQPAGTAGKQAGTTSTLSVEQLFKTAKGKDVGQPPVIEQEHSKPATPKPAKP